jgi:WD40 repeat protein
VIPVFPKGHLMTFAKWNFLGGPVTCVTFLASDDEVLICQGPYLRIFSLRITTTDLSQDTSWTSSPKIHKPSCEDDTFWNIHGARQLTMDTLLLFGGHTWGVFHHRELKFLPINEREYINSSDWIWDMRKLGTNDDYDSQKNDISILLLATANNGCEIWHLQRDSLMSYKAYRASLVTNEVRCITYSMALYEISCTQSKCSKAKIRIASGTFFQEILLWSLDIPYDGEGKIVSSEERTIDARLTGHDGVILSIQFDASGTMLASTSDDRSVRLWKEQSPNEWVSIWLGWGHTARVWQVSFSLFGLVTSGEDGTARLWDLKDGKEIGTFHNFASQSLWKMDIRSRRVLLGTNDGSIKCWDLQKYRTNNSIQSKHKSLPIMIPDDRISILPRRMNTIISDLVNMTDEMKESKCKRKKRPKVVMQIVLGMCFFNNYDHGTCLSLATRTGSFFILSLHDWNWISCTRWIGQSQELVVNPSEGTCLAISNTCIVVVGTKKGALIFHPLGIAEYLSITEGQKFKCINSLHWISDELLASFHIQGKVVLWKISTTPLSVETFLVLDTQINEIPTCIGAKSDLLTFVVGDSRGNLARFHVEPASESGEKVVVFPIDVCHRLHGKEHINDILIIHDEIVFSVGNDGCICQCSLRYDTKLMRGICIPIKGLSSACKIYWKGTNGFPDAIVIAGYLGNKFRVIELAHGYELYSFETGGRQRQLCHSLVQTGYGNPQFSVAACASRIDGQNDLLLYTNVNETSNDDCLVSVGVSLHGEPVYGACLFNTQEDASYTALLSGSEDCTVKLTILDRGGVRHSFSLVPQESCVRAVAASRRKGSNSSLLVVGGGKLIVDFYVLQDDNKDDGTTMDFIGRDHFFTRHIRQGRLPHQTDMDHRINAVAAQPWKEESSHLVVTGDSNGCVYWFVVKEDLNHRNRWSGLLGMTTERPILSIDLVISGNIVILVVGTTAGDVLVWVLPSDLNSPAGAPICRYAAHQMGTNGISSLALSLNNDNKDDDATYLRVASVGDDQALTVAYLKVNSQTCEILHKHTTREACISALKGCHFVNPSKVIVVGYGQRIALWECSASEGNKLLETIDIAVADVNTLAYCSGIVAVGGEGIEILELSL